MAEALMASFAQPEAALRAVAGLKTAGVPQSSLTVMSARPLQHKSAQSGAHSHIVVFAVAGGLIGAVAGCLLTVIPSRTTGLVTGGMPLVTPWAFGVVVFEMAALCAILGALGRMIFEAKLLRRGPTADVDAALSRGGVVLAVDYGGDQARRQQAQSVLTDHEATILDHSS